MKLRHSLICRCLSAAILVSACANPVTAYAAADITASADTTAAADTKTLTSTSASPFGSMDSIVEAASVRATCQDDVKYCVVDINDEHNPYDVTWDFGEAWNSYVEACDWSLDFDVEYYKKAYPILALQYNYDDALLLEHFATVGVHEGRQGNEDFNVEAYINNASPKVQKAFSGQIEGAYIYYMLHYDTEASVNTVTKRDGSAPRTQLWVLYTAFQKKEFIEVNKYRAKVGAEDLVESGEMNAFANYRAYINRVLNVAGHGWAMDNRSLMMDYLAKIDPNAYSLAENTITGSRLQSKDTASMYADSEEHYEAMVSTEYNYIGTSNVYINDSRRCSVFDMFY